MVTKEREKRVTLRDVSRSAGVSPMTVSNVVRGDHHLVKLETRAKVEEAIARLNYRPNLSARSLRLSRASSIGILISDTNPAFLTDPFISRLVSGLSNYLSELDFTLDVQGVSPERFESATILSKAGNDALCVILCGPKRLRRRHVEHLVRMDQPVIIFQENNLPHSNNICLLSQDDFEGGSLIGRHLADKEVRSLLFVRPKLDWVAVEQRERGLRFALGHSGSEINIETIMTPSEDFEDVHQAVKDYLSRSTPDAIVGATDVLGAAALKACADLKIAVPETTLVTGFNGFDVWCYTTPNLTTVMSPAYEMGRQAGQLLLARLKDGVFSERNTVFPVSLQIGASTEAQ
ncbi:MAG: LacI family transcriptional regulator [Rhodocyclaceae bacterium]|nr:MAG: LacI family transcriptional regulator [Rhodocyclaceae bacterium]